MSTKSVTCCPLRHELPSPQQRTLRRQSVDSNGIQKRWPWALRHILTTVFGLNQKLFQGPKINPLTIVTTIDTEWVCKHGCPRAISVDDEYKPEQLGGFCWSHSIEYKPRPARRHKKVLIVEKSHSETYRRYTPYGLKPVERQDPTGYIHFVLKHISGSKLLSSFQVVRVFRPSLLGLPRCHVSKQVTDAHPL